jgi:hypothetical protein
VYLADQSTPPIVRQRCYHRGCEETICWVQKTQAVGRGEKSDHLLLYRSRTPSTLSFVYPSPGCASLPSQVLFCLGDLVGSVSTDSVLSPPQGNAQNRKPIRCLSSVASRDGKISVRNFVAGGTEGDLQKTRPWDFLLIRRQPLHSEHRSIPSQAPTLGSISPGSFDPASPTAFSISRQRPRSALRIVPALPIPASR